MPSWWGLTKRLTYTSQESCQSVYCCSWSMLKSFLKSNTRIFGMRPCISQSCSTLPLRSSPGFGTALIVVCSIPEFAPVSPVDVELGVGFGPGFDVGLGVELDVGLGFGFGVRLGLGLGVGPGFGLDVGLGLGVGLAAGLGVGLGFGLGVGLAFGLGLGLGVGLGLGLGVGLGLAFGPGCSVGVGAGPAGDVGLDVGPVDGMIGFR